MIDIFLVKDVLKLFKDKHVVFMGDSNVRAQYKDMLCLLQHNTFISTKILKKKMEDSCYGDRLIHHGNLSNYRRYREERKSRINNMNVSFYFITSIYDKYVEYVLDYLSKSHEPPDVLIVNSCLWDVSRWGPQSVALYKKNLVTFLKELKKCLPNCLVIWLTTPPISQDVKGGFLLKEIEFLKYSLRFHVMEANNYARKVVVEHGFDILDWHYHLQWQIHLRCDDGIHWTYPAVRYTSSLILSHISLAWNCPLPHRFNHGDGEIEENTAAKNEDVTSNNKHTISGRKHIINKENNTVRHSPIRVPSRPVESSNMVETENVKRRREEFVEPITPKRNTNNKKKHFQESYHAHSKRMDHDHRLKRIRARQRNALGTLSTEYHNSPCQQDSGYFSSPNQSQFPFHETQKFINSPHRIPLPPNPPQFSFYDPQKFVNSPQHIPLPLNPYPNHVIPNSPVHLCGPQIPDAYSQGFDTRQVIHPSSFNNRRTLLPNVNNQMQFKPEININFTNDNPFGIYF